jgi:hypothetical protein
MFETLKNANTSKANAGRINYLNFYWSFNNISIITKLP